MHLSEVILEGGGEVTPGTYAGMARDLSTLFDNFKPGMGGLGFCTFVAGSQGGGGGETRGICEYL